MLDPPRGISLPPGSTVSALCITPSENLVVGTVEGRLAVATQQLGSDLMGVHGHGTGFVYVLGLSGELEGSLASKHGHITQIAYSAVWNRFVCWVHCFRTMNWSGYVTFVSAL
jgi:hypothetical protein